MAEAGAFGIDDLRRFKLTAYGVHGPVAFGWLADRCLIRLGGCYALGVCRVALDGLTVLEVRSGPMRVNFRLKDQDDADLAWMTDNAFAFDASAVDDLSVSASGHQIKVWSDVRKIGFFCRFTRISRSELEMLVGNDAALSALKARRSMEEVYGDASDGADMIAALGFGTGPNPCRDVVLSSATQILAGDGTLPLLNFVGCRFFNRGQLEILEGRFEGMHFCYGSSFEFVGEKLLIR